MSILLFLAGCYFLFSGMSLIRALLILIAASSHEIYFPLFLTVWILFDHHED